MKKVYCLFLILTLCLLTFTSCIEQESYDRGYDRGYEDGYDDAYNEGHYEGYDEGYYEGEEWGKESLAYDYEDVCSDEVQDAVTILLDYAEQDGEYTEEDLKDAAWIMAFYYQDVCDLIGYEP